MNQRAFSGFLFALLAAAMWGALPIGLQQVLKVMDPQTIVWYRFAIAGLGLLLILAGKRTLPDLKRLHRRYVLLILLGIFGLSVNFVLFNIALQYIPPTTSQVLSPLSSFVMLLVGVFVFKEKMGMHQKIGLVVLIIGLILFFNDHFADFMQFNLYFKGVLIAFIASTIWVAYGIAQKILLLKFSSQQILLLIYLGCALIFLPFSSPKQLFELNGLQLGCLLFCCANTLIAYGSYAEALNRWEVSKVSAMMTQISIFTIIFSEVLAHIAPAVFSDQQLNSLSYFGAVLVVSGSLLSAIGHKLPIGRAAKIK